VSVRARLRRPLVLALVLGLGLGTLAWLLPLGPAGRTLEHKGLDLLFLLRGAHAAPDDVVIVAIDEPSFARLALQWPWPRSVHARLTDRLRAAGARVIAFDVLFAEPSAPAEDRALADAFRRAGNVVLATDHRVLEGRGGRRTVRVAPLPLFQESAAAVGVVNQGQDRDGVIRWTRAELDGLPAFAAAAARLAGGGWSPGPGPFLVNHVGPSPAFTTVSYWEALDPAEAPDDLFRDRVVLVGRAAGPAGRPVDDSHFTPFFWLGRRPTPGVELHASILDTVLRARPIARVPDAAHAGWALGWALVAGVLAGRLAPWRGLAVTGALVAVQGATALTLFAASERWLPWVGPALASGAVYASTMVVRWRRTERERAFIQSAFQRYLHPTVVQALIDDPARLRLGGESVEVTVCFTDLAGFTRVAEKLTPAELVTLVNEYLSAMTGVVLAHRGMLNQMLGDGILAIWNVPVASPAHPLEACRAALAMQARLADLNRQWAAQGRPPLAMRIGLHTGPAVAGNIGSPEHFHYGVMGDTVNLASRLEQVNKLYGSAVMVSEDTARRVEADLVLRPLDLLRVVGRAEPVRIYECVGAPGEIAPARSALLAAFAEGLAAYQARDWARALVRFEAAAAVDADDGPTRVYLERARQFLVEPPPDDWDGVYTARSKSG
jgi:adenylate cyclase